MLTWYVQVKPQWDLEEGQALNKWTCGVTVCQSLLAAEAEGSGVGEGTIEPRKARLVSDAGDSGALRCGVWLAGCSARLHQSDNQTLVFQEH